ncbi:hypothetical protein BZA70DRAFT_196479 [Myxozyma melibiosi]|uniref:ENTH domain-containing protein n=1 Tax=Myxozyma melibiosi TaxID=54550 RepID=A0ABR1F3Y3_9ASCO
MATRSIIRSIKNVSNGYSQAQVKVRRATSNDNWGPDASDLDDIALMTFNIMDFYDIMEMLDKRLNDKGKNWRHVLKALVVLDYALHFGAENVVRWTKDNIYVIKTLREFAYIDEIDNDCGINIRLKSIELVKFLKDDERIRYERAHSRKFRSKIIRQGHGYFDAASAKRMPVLVTSEDDPSMARLFRNSEDDEYNSRRPIDAEYDSESTDNESRHGQRRRRRAYTNPTPQKHDQEDLDEIRESLESRAAAKKEAERSQRRARALSSAAALSPHPEEHTQFGAVRVNQQPEQQQPIAIQALQTQSTQVHSPLTVPTDYTRAGFPTTLQPQATGMVFQPNSQQIYVAQSAQFQQPQATGFISYQNTGMLTPVSNSGSQPLSQQSSTSQQFFMAPQQQVPAMTGQVQGAYYQQTLMPQQTGVYYYPQISATGF